MGSRACEYLPIPPLVCPMVPSLLSQDLTPKPIPSLSCVFNLSFSTVFLSDLKYACIPFSLYSQIHLYSPAPFSHLPPIPQPTLIQFWLQCSRFSSLFLYLILSIIPFFLIPSLRIFLLPPWQLFSRLKHSKPGSGTFSLHAHCPHSPKPRLNHPYSWL